MAIRDIPGYLECPLCRSYGAETVLIIIKNNRIRIRQSSIRLSDSHKKQSDMINKKHISLLTLAIFLSLSHFAVSASAQPSVVEVPSVSVQPSVDSLSHYLEQAARSNPQVNADFMLYKASLEKIPQAGAFADPELEIGFFVKPMETLMGKQIADFTLMQMFPWFGTRKAARSEASEMGTYGLRTIS